MQSRSVALPSLVLAASIALALPLTLIGCTQQSGEEAPVAETPAQGETVAADTAAQDEAFPADHILVQHVLVGFQGSVAGKNITRTQAEAEVLANEILAKAKAGDDFGALVQQYTDDAYPGIYGLANSGVTPGQNEFPREQMVKGFSDVSFTLRTGDIGISAYDKATSPFGWHIIKRVD